MDRDSRLLPLRSRSSPHHTPESPPDYPQPAPVHRRVASCTSPTNSSIISSRNNTPVTRPSSAKTRAKCVPWYHTTTRTPSHATSYTTSVGTTPTDRVIPVASPRIEPHSNLTLPHGRERCSPSHTPVEIFALVPQSVCVDSAGTTQPQHSTFQYRPRRLSFSIENPPRRLTPQEYPV